MRARVDWSRTLRAALLPLGAAAATLVMTWPLAPHAADHILAAAYHWDAYTNAMIMGGRVDAILGRGPLGFYDNYFFAPLPQAIVFNENLFGITVLFAPFYLLFGNPLLAYNCTVLLSLGLSVYFTALLVRRLTNNAAAGFLAGVAFAFCPYVVFELGRLQLLATQWIPACFLCLHRAFEQRRARDVALLAMAYLLQIGTCLYYAMFLIPLLAFAGGVLLLRHRPPLRFYLRLGTAAAGVGGVALAMVYPYFAARSRFDLERASSFASSYDGKLSFFANASPANLTLSALHHQGAFRGAHEEIAFPGIGVAVFVLCALVIPLRVALVRLGKGAASALGRWVLLLAAAVGVTLLFHSMLIGVFLLGVGGWVLSRLPATPSPFAGQRGLYLALVLLAVGMFLGLEPFAVQGAPVHGLYYYFHTYFPGFNGIRKVSRQAVMTTFALVVLGSFGAAELLSRVPLPRQRAVFAALLAFICWELRAFPNPIKPVWAGSSVPEVYRYLATKPPEELVATFPQNTGVSAFRGDHGLALHNYLMLYHKHRSLNGQSSWEPTVTTLVNRALARLPDDASRRLLLAVGARHLVIHGGDLEPARRELPAQLRALSTQYRQEVQSGQDVVFELLPDPDPTLALQDTPALPAGARPVPAALLRAQTSVEPAAAALAVDGNPETAWSSRRVQFRGQSFEVLLDRARPIVAFEIHNAANQTQVPMAYEFAVAAGGGAWQPLVEQPLVRVPRDLVFSPKHYVFRIVLPAPVNADRVRITLRQPVSGTGLTIAEARLYEAGPPLASDP